MFVCVCVCVCVSEAQQGQFLPLGAPHFVIPVMAKPLHPIFRYEHRHDGFPRSASD